MLLITLLLATQPLTRVGANCPPGYLISAGYCVPRSYTSAPAVVRDSTTCPPGYFLSGQYCTKY